MVIAVCRKRMMKGSGRATKLEPLGSLAAKTSEHFLELENLQANSSFHLVSEDRDV